MKEGKKKIKYKGKVKKSNYLSNPDIFQSYMILNTQKFEEIKTNSVIESSEEKNNLNTNLVSDILDISSMKAKIINKKKREGD